VFEQKRGLIIELCSGEEDQNLKQKGIGIEEKNRIRTTLNQRKQQEKSHGTEKMERSGGPV
jgi:alpha-D-ribose 1-methylphosphonate 5-triphosphate synthase subunit PhnH